MYKKNQQVSKRKKINKMTLVELNNLKKEIHPSSKMYTEIDKQLAVKTS